MATYRKKLEYWTETHRVIGDEVKVVTCCCAAPAASRKECAKVNGTKSPCGCFCHSNKICRRMACKDKNCKGCK